MQNKDSASMMDHYFDKLLQIAKFEPEVVQNDFLCEEAEKRVEPLVQVCLEWGQSGSVPEKLIASFAKSSSEEKKVDEIPSKKDQKGKGGKLFNEIKAPRKTRDVKLV